MRLSTVVLGLCATLAIASPVPEPEAVPTIPDGVDWNQVVIEDVQYSGTGCPPKSVAVSKATDWQTVTLAFSQYVASIGGGAAVAEKRKNCNINLKIKYPKNIQYTVYKTDYTGFVDLDKKVKAYQQSDYWFAGFAGNKATLRSEWQGEYSAVYTFTDTLVADKCVWSPCGSVTTLNINTAIWLDNKDNPKGTGLITTDVIDHKVKSLHYFSWRKC